MVAHVSDFLERVVNSTYRTVIVSSAFAIVLLMIGFGLDQAGWSTEAGIVAALAALTVAISFAGFGVLWSLGKIGY